MPDHTFDIYRLLVEEARDARRSRRELSNIFLTLNIAGVGGLGLIGRDGSGFDSALFIGCAIGLVLICMIWGTSNRYYTSVLKQKYIIICDYEARLGEKPIYEEYIATGGAKRMRAFTLERAMPALFIVGYIVFSVLEWRAQLAPWWDGLSDIVRGWIG